MPLVNIHMRDIATIDNELRMQALAWSVAREFGVETTTADIDQLLDERNQCVGGNNVGADGVSMYGRADPVNSPIDGVVGPTRVTSEIAVTGSP